MNILDIQDKLKGLSQEQLAQEMQSPTGQVPQFLVLGEMSRRQAMRQSMQQQNAGSQTVAQELLNGAGMPSEGMTDMAQTMAPKSSIAENTGIGSLPQEAPPHEEGGLAALAAQEQQPVGMYAGGQVRKMQVGGTPPSSPLGSMSIMQLNVMADNGDDAAIAELRRREIASLGGSGIAAMIQSPSTVQNINPAQNAEDRAQAGVMDRGATRDRAAEATSALELYVSQNPQDTAAASRLADAQRELDAASAAVTAPVVAPTGSQVIDSMNLLYPAIPQTNALDTPVDTGGGGGGGAGGGSGGGGGKMSTYEQMLAEAMKNAEKTAKQDKWLALAQAGAALYSGASVGDAVNTGISALQSARDTGEQNKLKLAQEMQGIQERQAAIARAAYSAGAGKSKPRSETSIISDINSIGEILSRMGGTNAYGEPIPLTEAQMATSAGLQQKRDALIQMLQGTGVDLSDPVQ